MDRSWFLDNAEGMGNGLETTLRDEARNVGPSHVISEALCSRKDSCLNESHRLTNSMVAIDAAGRHLLVEDPTCLGIYEVDHEHGLIIPS